MNAQASQTIDPTAAKAGKALAHARQLLGCWFSPCGKFVFAGGTDKQALRWDLETDEKQSLAGHASWVDALAFSADGERAVTADFVGGLRCWKHAAAKPECLWSVAAAHPVGIRAVATSSDGRLVATAGNDAAVRLWSLADGKPLGELGRHDARIMSLAFHPDGKTLVSGDRHGHIKQWDAAAGKLARTLDGTKLWSPASLNESAGGSGVTSLAFDPAGERLAATGVTNKTDGDRRGGDSTVLLFDVASGRESKMYIAKKAGYAECVLFHPEGWIIAGCQGQDSGSVQFWKAEGGEPAAKIECARKGCRDVSLHPGGTQLAVTQWIQKGRVGNNPSTEGLEAFVPHEGAVQIYELTVSG